MSHLRDIVKPLTEKHLTLFLRLAIVRVSAKVHVGAAIFIRETRTISRFEMLLAPLSQQT